MKISGTVANSKNYEPIALAKIRLEVQDKEIGVPFFTDEHGFYEFKTDEDYIGQTLTYTIEKDGFEEKTFSTVIDKAEIHKKFILRETEILKDRLATLKGFFYGVIIFGILILLFISFQPLADYEVQKYNESVELNDEITVDITIKRNPFPIWWNPLGKLDWELKAEEKYIQLNKSNGKEPATVHVTIVTPDFQFSPGQNYTANISLNNKNLDNINKLFAEDKIEPDKVIKINFTPLEKKKKPKLNITIYQEPDTYKENEKFTISIINTGNGIPWWTLRSDKIWIELWNDTKMSEPYNSNERRSDNGKVYFKINMSNIEEENKTVEGNITLGYNNDGKDKIHIFVCENASPPVNWTIESWYLPDYYNKTVREPLRPNNCTA